ncbi:ribosomal protein uL18 [Cardinium endosymbiont of Sogatella furcifera]|uniref:50S ribosomal protein L18 n=1 Tax=Cardinium endosymbiont of Sogatella furcifera TaxID=650378 RepID=UPI000E0DC78F|nr:50S ribosomal protein L18 [Cardinium endosymbiont of Sogatella furcifera]AXI24506.1 ribosomal protein uL18 [Cardinium endosymbiont of Sogatella furcifera]
MKIKDKKVERRLKVRKRIRKRVHGTRTQPRLSLFKSNTSMYAQLINDDTGETLLSSSLYKLKISKNNVAGALELGKAIAEQAIAKGITAIVFDRSGYIYHGKVKALAEGARAQGLKF